MAITFLRHAACSRKRISLQWIRCSSAVRQVEQWRPSPLWSSRNRSSSGVTALAAALPTAPLVPADGVAALERLLRAAEKEGRSAVNVCAEPQVQAFLDDLKNLLKHFEAQQLRDTLAAFARVQYIPPDLWSEVALEMPRALDELPDLHVVHIALLMSTLELRSAPLLLQEVAEQLDQRAPSLGPMGLVGAAVALSQLGPWPDPVPGGTIIEELVGHLQGALKPNELSACVLAVATLGVGDNQFWHMAHNALLARVDQLGPRNIADALLALATTQRCPISLLEGLQSRLAHVAEYFGAEDALTSSWALCAMQLYPKSSLPLLLETACKEPITSLSRMQVNQLRQVALTLELEPSAAVIREAVPRELLRPSPAVSEIAATNSIWGTLAGELPRGPCAVVAEIRQLLSDLRADVSEGYGASDDFYTLDLVVRPPSQPMVSIVLDDVSSAHAATPEDPWTMLKRRHLLRLGWRVEWLPTRRWRQWSEEDQRRFLADIASLVDSSP